MTLQHRGHRAQLYSVANAITVQAGGRHTDCSDIQYQCQYIQMTLHQRAQSSKSCPGGRHTDSPTISTDTANVRIIDNDGVVNISVDTNSITEGNAMSVATFTVEAIGVVPASGVSVSVNISGSATINTDYDLIGLASSVAVITLTDSKKSKSFSIQVIDDSDIEIAESVEVSISGELPANVVFGTTEATITIVSEDVDPALPVTFSVVLSSDKVNEGDTVDLTISGVAGVYTYAVSGITADDISGIGLSGMFMLSSIGQTVVKVTVVDDVLSEGAETVEITVTAPAGVTLSATTVISASDPLSVSVSDASDVTEGDNVSSEFNISVSGGIPTSDVTVSYSTEDGTAEAGTDYTSVANAIVTFSASTDCVSSCDKTVSVSIIDDTILEDLKQFSVRINSATGGGHSDSPTISTDTAIARIVDNDGVVNINVDTNSITEGSAMSVATFTVEAIGVVPASGISVSVNISGSATINTDYDLIELASSVAVITLTDSNKSKSFSIQVIDDTDIEIAETVEVSISGELPANVVFGTTEATITIVSEDVSPALPVTFSVVLSSDKVNEGDTVELTISGVAGVYTYAVSGIQADDISGIGLSGVFMLTAIGQTVVKVTVVDDVLSEGAESVLFTVTAPDGATISVNTVISASDPLSVSISNAVDVTESAGVSAEFIISVSGGIPTSDVTVTYSTEDGTAEAGTDYTSVANAIVMFGAGTDCVNGCSETVAVSIIDDTILENIEQFSVKINSATGGGHTDSPIISTDTAIARIIDNDGVVNINVDTNSITEGSAMSVATFTVEATGVVPASGISVSVNISGSATINTDYDLIELASSVAVITLTDSKKNKSFSIRVIDDSDIEIAETVEVFISGELPANVVFGTTEATITIVSEDVSPALPTTFSVVLSSDKVNEGDTVDLTISGVAGVYTYAVSGIQADDISGIGLSGVFMLSSIGQTVVKVTVVDDVLSEGTESLMITVTNPAGATISVSTVISASDPLSVSVSDASDVTESAGVSSEFIISVSGGIPTSDVTVSYSTEDGTAEAGTDYTSVANAIVMFGAGTDCVNGCSETVSVSIIDDTTPEGTEQFRVKINSATGGGHTDSPIISTDTAIARILDNDGVVNISVDDAIITEGDTMSVATFTVEATGVVPASGISVSVNISGSATINTDYDLIELASSVAVITLTDSKKSKSFSIQVIDDPDIEIDESVEVSISGELPVGLRYGTTEATITIVSEDVSPALPVTFSVVLSSDKVNEGDTVDLTISGVAGVYTYAVSGIQADDISGIGLSGVFMLSSIGQTVVKVTVVDDVLSEGAETVEITVTAPAGVTLSATTVISASDPLSVSVSDASDVTESTGVSAEFIISVSGGIPTEDVTVTYSTEEGTATAGTDYTSVANAIVTFSASTDCVNGCSETVSVSIIDDTTPEGTEQFSVRVNSATGGGHSESPVIVDATGVGTIQDSDTLPFSVTVSAVTVSEGDTVTLTLQGAVGVYTYAISGVSANDVNIALSGNVSVGVTGKHTLDVTIVDDVLSEGTESLMITVTNPDSIGLSVITVISESDPLSVRVLDAPSVSEGDAGADSKLEFIVRVSGGIPTSDVVVSYRTEGGSATAGEDYQSVRDGELRLSSSSCTNIPCDEPIEISLLGDNEAEGDESVELHLLSVSVSSGLSVSISDALGIGTILNDDYNPVVLIPEMRVLSLVRGTSVSVELSSVFSDRDDPVLSYTVSVLPVSSIAEVSISGGVLYVSGIGLGVTEFSVSASDGTNPVVSSMFRATVSTEFVPVVRVSGLGVELSEGEVGRVKVSLTQTSSVGTVLYANYVITGGTDISSQDFSSDSLSGRAMLDYSVGVDAYIEVEISSDGLFESVELFELQIVSIDGGVIEGSGVVTGSIGVNVGELLELTISDAFVSEDAGVVMLPVVISGALSSKDVLIDVSVRDVDAKSGADYGLQSVSPLVVPAGVSRGEVSVVLVDDVYNEGEEKFEVVLGNVLGGGGVSSQLRVIKSVSVVTIRRSDAITVSLSLLSERVDESVGDSGVSVELSGGLPTSDVLVSYVLTTGVGTLSSDDYDDVNSGMLSITHTDCTALGCVSSLGLEIVDDSIEEGLEGPLTVSLSSAVSSGGGDVRVSSDADKSVVELSINESDGVILSTSAVLSIDRGTVRVSEGGSAKFVVLLSDRVNSDIDIDWELLPSGSASSDDFVSTSGKVSIPSDVLSYVIEVGIVDDVLYELDEQFELRISVSSSSVHSVSGDGKGVGVILGNDGGVLSVSRVGFSEVREGSKAMFTVSLDSGFEWGSVSESSADSIRVDVSVGGDVDSADYMMLSPSATTLVFERGGSISKSLEYAILSDGDYSEGREELSLSLSGVSPSDLNSISVVSGEASVYIPAEVGREVHVDVMVSGSGFVNEGEDVTIMFTLSGDGYELLSGASVTVEYMLSSIADLTVSSAMGDVVMEFGSGSECTSLPCSKSVVISVLDDDLSEGVESVRVSLGALRVDGGVVSVVGGSMREAIFSIRVDRADDFTVELSPSSGSITEDGNDGVDIGVNVVLSGGIPTSVVEVSYRVSGDVSGDDYRDANNGVLSISEVDCSNVFADDKCVLSLGVELVDDVVREIAERILLVIEGVNVGGVLSTEELLVVSKSSSVVLISESDPAEVSVSTPIGEVSEDVGVVLFTVSSSQPLDAGELLEVDVSIMGTANINTDYEVLVYSASAFTVALDSASQQSVVSIRVLDDEVFEYAESIEFSLTGVNGASNSKLSSGGDVSSSVIVEDNELLSLRVVDSVRSVSESVGSVKFDVMSDKVVSSVVTLAVSVLGGEATEGTDYVVDSIKHIDSSGSGYVSIDVLDDIEFELLESALIALTVSVDSRSSRVSVLSSVIMLSIDSEDPLLVGLDEVASGVTLPSKRGDAGEFVIGLNGVAPSDVSVEWYVEDALGAVVVSGVNVIPTGMSQTRVSVTIPTDVDEVSEGIEAYVLTLSKAMSMFALSIDATKQSLSFNAVDDDVVNVIIKSSAVSSISEGDSAVFVLELDGVSTSDIQVMLSLSGATLSDTTVVIPAMSSVASFTVSSVEDAIVESTSTLEVMLLSVSGANGVLVEVGSVSVSSVLVIDDDSAELSVDTRDVELSEGASVDVTVVLSVELAYDIEVFWSVIGDTADVNPSSGSLLISAGSKSGKFRLSGVLDKVVEGEESVGISLSSYKVDASISSRVSIVDDSKRFIKLLNADKTSLSVSTTATSVSEGGSVRFVFSYTGGVGVGINVRYNVLLEGLSANALDISSSVVLSGSGGVLDIVIPSDNAAVGDRSYRLSVSGCGSEFALLCQAIDISGATSGIIRVVDIDTPPTAPVGGGTGGGGTGGSRPTDTGSGTTFTSDPPSVSLPSGELADAVIAEDAGPVFGSVFVKFTQADSGRISDVRVITVKDLFTPVSNVLEIIPANSIIKIDSTKFSELSMSLEGLPSDVSIGTIYDITPLFDDGSVEQEVTDVSAEVCLPIPSRIVRTARDFYLYHYVDADGDGVQVWERLDSVVTEGRTHVCAQVSSFSLFALGYTRIEFDDEDGGLLPPTGGVSPDVLVLWVSASVGLLLVVYGVRVVRTRRARSRKI